MSVFRVGNKSSNNTLSILANSSSGAEKQIFNSTAELDFPTVLPTLNLDFANSRTLDSRISFTRSSGGSYLDQNGVIKYAGINEPRFDHNPETSESLGLLFEEQRTNLLAWSQNFNQWTRHRDTSVESTITVTESNELSPDGISNFFLCTYGITDLRRNFPGGFGRTYTASCFYKRPNQPDSSDVAAFEVHIPGGTTSIVQITYSFSQNRVTRFTGNVPRSFGFKKYPNGVVRLWLTMTATGANQSVFFLNLRGINTNQSILTWGAQVEEGTFPTSYIPTLGSARTRAADDAVITGKNFTDFYNQKEGTIFVAHKATDQLSNRGSDVNSLIYNISIDNQLGLFYNTQSDLSDIIRFGPDNLQTPTIGYSQTQQSRNKAIFSYNGTTETYSPYIDGNKITQITDKNPYKLTNYNNLRFARQGENERFNGHIQKFTYFPKSLPDSQLQSFTL